MRVLGIETSCDETSVAVVDDATHVRSNVTHSQVDAHRPYGGVVPELASRQHVEMLPRVLDAAMAQAEAGWETVDAVAVTYGPGLASSLMVGVAAAKALALRLDRPLIGINHLEAHMFSPFLMEDAPTLEGAMPFLSLVISGGHTCLLRAENLGDYRLLGQTVDDAAGEAFDKGAMQLGLGYPGGPVIDRLAKEGDPNAVRFPRGRQRAGRRALGGLNPDLCFSFSGLKTALLYYLKDHPLSPERTEVPSLAASYQEAIVDAVVKRCDLALGSETLMTVGGGVSLNSRLRAALASLAKRRGVRLLLAKPAHCGDNAAMIAALAGWGGGVRGAQALQLDVKPSLGIGRLA